MARELLRNMCEAFNGGNVLPTGDTTSKILPLTN